MRLLKGAARASTTDADDADGSRHACESTAPTNGGADGRAKAIFLHI
jgi:hypothetical protein